MNLINLIKSATPWQQAEEKTTDSGKKTVRFAKNLITSFHENVVENSQSQEDESEATEHHANEEGQ